MGIYLSNMEMPRKGQMLVIFPDGTSYVCFNGMRERLTQTTAIHVPDHGRLIDLDATINALPVAEPDEKVSHNAMIFDFIMLLEKMPTVIPAELPKEES